MAIVKIIDCYMAEHPRAADTPTGIRMWWIERQSQNASPADVQEALDHLVEQGRLSRTVLPDGTMIYGRATA